MRALRLAAVAAGCIALTAPATLAAAAKLEVPLASERSNRFAKGTCDRDKHCIDYGVLNCRRQSRRTVLCRIFDERRTKVQGRYRCERLIRVALDPPHRIPVTGLGRWHC
jgi:hypothetical protein